MSNVGMKGRLLITPKCATIAPFEVPKDKDKETWFCTAVHDGELYYYTGKTQESAAASYHSSIVTVLQSHTEAY